MNNCRDKGHLTLPLPPFSQLNLRGLAGDSSLRVVAAAHNGNGLRLADEKSGGLVLQVWP